MVWRLCGRRDSLSAYRSKRRFHGRDFTFEVHQQVERAWGRFVGFLNVVPGNQAAHRAGGEISRLHKRRPDRSLSRIIVAGFAADGLMRCPVTPLQQVRHRFGYIIVNRYVDDSDPIALIAIPRIASNDEAFRKPLFGFD